MSILLIALIIWLGPAALGILGSIILCLLFDIPLTDSNDKDEN